MNTLNNYLAGISPLNLHLLFDCLTLTNIQSDLKGKCSPRKKRSIKQSINRLISEKQLSKIYLLNFWSVPQFHCNKCDCAL